jgi:hypothetical protein
MSDQTFIESLKSELLVCLEETVEHVHGIYLDGGTSLFETLDTLSAKDASRPSAGGGATIAAHVEHIRFYLDVILDLMRTGEPKRHDWSEIWQRVGAVTPDEWDASKRELRAAYANVVATIGAYDRWDGEHGIAGGLAMLTHTAYHLGAIRQMVRVIVAAKALEPRASIATES